MKFILVIIILIISLFAQKISSPLSAALSKYVDIYNNSLYYIDEMEYIHSEQKVAVILPKKISGKYILSTPKTILSYLLFSKKNFNLKVYIIDNELDFMIEDALSVAEIDGYDIIIPILTTKSVDTLLHYASNSLALFFLPTINKQDYKYTSNVFFGGIDYKKQIDTLEQLIVYDTKETKQNRFVFSTSGNMSVSMFEYINTTYPSIMENYTLGKNNNYAKIFDPDNLFETPSSKEKEEIEEVKSIFDDSIVYLNTPILKSSLVLSQARYYEVKPKYFLSTQINYHPLILTLSQFEDRKNMYIANSITSYNTELEDINRVFNNDIRFDWINYSSSIGLDYVLNFTNSDMFTNSIEANQIVYEVDIYKPSLFSFKRTTR